MPLFLCSYTISIHTPARGVTGNCGFRAFILIYFNPHSRKGSDDKVYFQIRHWVISIHTPARGVTGTNTDSHRSFRISIHTPARGVTGSDSSEPCKRCNFNPHSRKGSDIFSIRILRHISISIHTPARGVTIIIRNIINYLRFQSTLPQGE